MIKYSDRGLVKNGKISRLYDQLYVVSALTAAIWQIGLGFVDYATNQEKDGDDFFVLFTASIETIPRRLDYNSILLTKL